ncbi:MAG: hypothetical protein BIFFINMI_03026 [Phycisphaerae bacterium]|nr:hypothetical protein [Phycisphaerae bacterium]
MIQRKRVTPAGAPEWMVTYGDMMGLLLTFFIMLVAMSEVKDNDKFRKVMEAVKEAFGYEGGMGTVVSKDAPENSLITRLDEISLENFKFKAGNAQDQGVEGRENTVRRIREGIEFTIGGRIGFDFGSAELREEAKAALQEVATLIRGENNKIEIRGHSTRAETGPDKKYKDGHELSFARATAVADYLVQLHIRPDRLRRVTCGSSEPLVQRAYDEQSKAANRRVEIIVNQSLVQQFDGGEHETIPKAPSSALPDELGDPTQAVTQVQIDNAEEEP